MTLLHPLQTDEPYSPSQMSAPGLIKSTSSTKFIAIFLIDDITYTLSGRIASSVQTFVSTNAILTYSSIEQLTALRSFAGKIGPHELTLAIANGPKITGALDGIVDPASNISGSGTWNGA
jgi:hypothetical protein